VILLAVALLFIVAFSGCCSVNEKTSPAFAEMPVSFSSKAECAEFSVELTKVTAWCDHMPIIEPGERRQYVALDVIIYNKTDKAIGVMLASACLNVSGYDGGEEVITGRSSFEFYDEGDRPLPPILVLAPKQEIKATLYGKRLFAEDRHGKDLRVSLLFTTGPGDVRVAGVGRIGRSS